MSERRNMTMLLDNVWDFAALDLAVGNAEQTMPLTNTQIYNNSRPFITTSKNEIKIVGTFSQLMILSGLVAWRHNWSNSATWQYIIYDGPNQTGNVVYDSAEVHALQQLLLSEITWQVQPLVSSAFETGDVRYSHISHSAVFGLSFSLTIKDPLNTLPDISVCRFYQGMEVSPEINFSDDHSSIRVSNEEQHRTEGGLFGQDKETWRRDSFTFPILSHRDKQFIEKGMNRVGLHNDWFISKFPGAGGRLEITHAYACKLKSYSKVLHNNIAPIIIEEC